MAIVDLPTRYGIIAAPDTDTHQYDWFRRTGISIDYQEIQLVRRLLAERPPGVALDVGASFGSWSLALAPVATMVLAFEPQTAIFDLLCRTIRLNDAAPKVRATCAAVGDRLGFARITRVDLDIPENFGGVVSLRDAPDGPTGEVFVTTVDHAAADHDVSFIKVDVEGYEPHVLRGAAATIARCRPLMAIEREHSHTDTEALARQIIEMGYAITENAMDFVCIPI